MSAVAGVSRIDSVMTGEELLARYTRQPTDLVLVATQHGAAHRCSCGARVACGASAGTVLVFGAPDDSGSIATTIAGGVRGFLRWDASRPELVSTLAQRIDQRGAAAGACSGCSGGGIGDRAGASGPARDGKSNGQIGRELYLAEVTVKTHARRIFRKLRVKDRAEAVAQGFRCGYVTYRLMFPVGRRRRSSGGEHALHHAIAGAGRGESPDHPRSRAAGARRDTAGTDRRIPRWTTTPGCWCSSAGRPE